MMPQATLLSDKLILRALRTSDAPAIQVLAGDERIADTTANIPHPYPEGAAQHWLREVTEKMAQGEQAAFAITSVGDDELLGSISLMDIRDGEAELGYWVGVPYWGRGIASAAVQRLVRHAFQDLRLRRLRARVLARNLASATVLLRQGFRHVESKSSTCGYRRQQEPTDFFELVASPETKKALETPILP